jgi:hypothetical protein
MAKFTQTRKFSTREEVTHTKLNDIMSTSTISNIKNADLDSSAAIAETKLAAISTANKVNITGLVATSQATGDMFYYTGTAWARLAIGTTGQKLKLAFDSYTKLCIHFNGTDGGTSFTDEIGKTITNTETHDTYDKACSHFDGADAATAYTDPIAGAYTFVGTAQLDTAQFKFGTASLLLDGNSDGVTLPDSANWTFGTGNFTIDCWVRFAGVSGQQFMVGQYADASNYWYLSKESDGTLKFTWKATTEITSFSGTWSPVINTWYHIAVVRNSGTISLYVNGTSVASDTGVSGKDFADIASVLSVGYNLDGGGTSFHNGWIEELRISKGIARWTANFTSPSYAYGTVAVSTTSPKFGTGSGFFGGLAESLTLADSADWNFGSGDFTIDLYFKLTTVDTSGAQFSFVEQYTDASNYWFFGFLSSATNTNFRVYNKDPALDLSFQTTLLSASIWYHVALVRSTNSWYCFLDGTQVGSTGSSSITMPDLGSVLNIGFEDSSTNQYFSGRIDELRISKGIARWTANFTPQTVAYGPTPSWTT